VPLLAAVLLALSPEVERGFDHFYNLDFEQAIGVFQALSKKHPDSPAVFNHLAQSILYRHMLRAGALETELVTGGNSFLRRPRMNPSKDEERQFDDAIAAAMRLSQARLDANSKDRLALYNLGASYGLRANYNFLVRKAWTDALRDATSSRKLHNRVSELDPGYIDARLTQGAHDYIVGSLPWHYRFLGFLAGFHGDREQGIRTLELVYRKGEDNRVEAAVLLATVYRREKRSAAAVPLLERLIKQYPRNYLFYFELAQMHADLGDKEKALAPIAEAERLKLTQPEKILYYRATVQFWYMDLTEALANFLKVTSRADGLDPNTGVTAWMRLGQTYDLLGQRAKAVEAYRRATSYAPGSYRARESEEYLRKPFRRSNLK
jgi:tetratricopeptide (TPR) repeat protein